MLLRNQRVKENQRRKLPIQIKLMIQRIRLRELLILQAHSQMEEDLQHHLNQLLLNLKQLLLLLKDQQNLEPFKNRQLQKLQPLLQKLRLHPLPSRKLQRLQPNQKLLKHQKLQNRLQKHQHKLNQNLLLLLSKRIRLLFKKK